MKTNTCVGHMCCMIYQRLYTSFNFSLFCLKTDGIICIVLFALFQTKYKKWIHMEQCSLLQCCLSLETEMGVSWSWVSNNIRPCPAERELWGETVTNTEKQPQTPALSLRDLNPTLCSISLLGWFYTLKSINIIKSLKINSVQKIKQQSGISCKTML